MKKLLIILSVIFLNFIVVQANDNIGGIEFNAEGETVSIIEANFEYPSVKVEYSNLKYLNEPIDGVKCFDNVLIINGEISSLLKKLKFNFIDKTAQANINFYFFRENIDSPDTGEIQPSYSLLCELKLSMDNTPEPTESPAPTNTPIVSPTITPTATPVSSVHPEKTPIETTELPNETVAMQPNTPTPITKIEKPIEKPKEVEKELVDNTDKVKITLVNTTKSNDKTNNNSDVSINVSKKSNNILNSINILTSAVIVLTALFVYQIIKYLFIVKK